MCHYCGKPGHKASECFKNKRGLGLKGKGNGKRVHEASTGDTQAQEYDEEDWSWEGLDVAPFKGDIVLGSLTVAPVRVFSVSPDVSNWILIDSGAAVSVCPLS